MDTSQLVTIAVTAVVTLIAKESAQWLWALIKKASTAKTTIAAIKTAFNRHNRAVMFDLLLVVFFTLLLVVYVSRPGTASRFDVVVIGADLAMILLSALVTIIDLAKASIARKKEILENVKSASLTSNAELSLLSQNATRETAKLPTE